jgi:hypothetical protein
MDDVRRDAAAQATVAVRETQHKLPAILASRNDADSA